MNIRRSAVKHGHFAIIDGPELFVNEVDRPLAAAAAK